MLAVELARVFEGCGVAGTNSGSEGGGGGGGGICQGTTTNAGSGRTPYKGTAALPSADALGGATTTSCAVAGDGYAIVTYAP